MNEDDPQNDPDEDDVDDANNLPWSPVPPGLQSLLYKHLEHEFGCIPVPTPSSGNSGNKPGKADQEESSQSPSLSLTDDAKTFVKLLVKSSVFFPGEDLEKAKSLELQSLGHRLHRSGSLALCLDPKALEELESEIKSSPLSSPATRPTETELTSEETSATGAASVSGPGKGKREEGKGEEERTLWTNALLEQLQLLNLQKTEPPLVIFVLGPSAAGKTWGCKRLMKSEEIFSQLLVSPEVSPKASPSVSPNASPNNSVSRGTVTDTNKGRKTSFISIDGAAMRGASRTWVEFSLYVAKMYGLSGFSDLYESYFKNYLESLKQYFIDAILIERASCVVPHTARDSEKFIKNYIDRFIKAGYKIQVLGVVASEGKCRENGVVREKKRGKQYSSRYHEASISSVGRVINYCHELASGERKSGVMIEPSRIQHASCWDCPYEQVIQIEERIVIDDDETGMKGKGFRLGGCPGRSENCGNPNGKSSPHDESASHPVFEIRRVDSVV